MHGFAIGDAACGRHPRLPHMRGHCARAGRGSAGVRAHSGGQSGTQRVWDVQPRQRLVQSWLGRPGRSRDRGQRQHRRVCAWVRACGRGRLTDRIASVRGGASLGQQQQHDARRLELRNRRPAGDRRLRSRRIACARCQGLRELPATSCCEPADPTVQSHGRVRPQFAREPWAEPLGAAARAAPRLLPR